MNRRLAGLAAVAAVLGGYLAFEGLDPRAPGPGDDAARPNPAATRAAAVKLNPLQEIDPETFPDIAGRPLFNPSRQPRPAEAATPPPPVVQQTIVEPPPQPPPAPQGPGPDDYRLLGVASGPDGRIAALRIAASGDVVYLREGEGVDQWSVLDIGERSIAIGTPEDSVTFSLFTGADAAAPGDGAPPGAAMPGQPAPLPLPLPMPLPRQMRQPGQPPLPEQHTVPNTGG